MTLVWIALASWMLVAVLYRAVALQTLRTAMTEARAFTPQPSAPTPHHPGGVVLLRPLRGAPSSFEPCLTSLLEAGETASVRIIAGVASPEDPAHDAFVALRFLLLRRDSS